MAVETSTYQSLKLSFQKLLPLVDDLSDGLGVLLLISMAISGWIFVYLFQLQQLSLMISLGLSSITLLPILILTRFWFALENLKDIPNVAEQIIEDVTEDAAQSWHQMKSGKRGALNFFGQAKKLFQIRTLIHSADDMLEQYFNIGPLVNPVYLFFGILSFFGLFCLFFVGLLLGMLTII